jgi:benzoyl-CoA reductase/2-hydroxyglutaryl-CoA dehydratase subunit BcrC/BadD/HgdB
MKIGLTTTVPVEVVLAGGHTCVDLNNIFITSPNPSSYINVAHEFGFPRSLCSWIKAQYSVIMQEGDFDAIIAVTTGDCSNTQAMTELLTDSGVPVFKFAYPIDNRTPYARKEFFTQVERLAEFLNAGMDDVVETFHTLKPLRDKLKRLDELTVQGKVNGEENHIWLVSSSDFNSDVYEYERKLNEFLREAEARPVSVDKIRLGYVGVPPIITDLYGFIQTRGAEIRFNEVQRQFSIPSDSDDLLEAYTKYTYPYDIFGRIEDIKREAAARKLDGIIHYVQSFCHRQVQDILMKKHLGLPILTIEADTPGTLDERSRIRIESFIEMLMERKR